MKSAVVKASLFVLLILFTPIMMGYALHAMNLIEGFSNTVGYSLLGVPIIAMIYFSFKAYLTLYVDTVIKLLLLCVGICSILFIIASYIGLLISAFLLPIIMYGFVKLADEES